MNDAEVLKGRDIMSSNFSFLYQNFPTLARQGELAERYLYNDPNSCIIKLGMMAETIVHYMMELDGIAEPEVDNTHANRIRILKREGLFPREIDNILYSIRKTRNDATHKNYESVEECKALLEMAYQLACWFEQTYGDWECQPDAFSMPEDNSHAPDYRLLLEEKEAELQALKQQIVDGLPVVSKSKRAERSTKIARQLKRSEAETRLLIDEQLRQVGWEADTINLRYSKGVRPQKGRNLAIAEWPTDSKVGRYGRADYALFVGTQMVGIVEAKAEHIDVCNVIYDQCDDYAKNIRQEDGNYIIHNDGLYQVPFVFATNGRPYLKQFEQKSGIWFRDLRHLQSARPLQGWMSPEGMMELLAQDIDGANQKLMQTTYDLLTDPNGLNLRSYQIQAIEAAEQAVLDGKSTALLSMATGTGKTRTVLGLIYRFLKAGRFKRILFLVDRTALGEQAQDVFKEVKIEDLLTLEQIYNIKELGDKEIDRETKIHVATVQSLIKRLQFNTEDTMPAVSDYDLIVVDEAHRGYTLDKEMGEDEVLYRDQADFQSRYRAVIEYFDAVKIGLTATPALHTTEIFGKPVFTYSYREAVIDGYLIDHDVPHTYDTKLSTQGINYNKGETVAIYDPVTGVITNSEELEDELHFDVDKFNRQVITESFNRTVLAEIANHINPEGPGKTLIFAVDDQHADMITRILKDLFCDLGVDADAVMKITGSIGGGNPKKVMEAIKRFKNEKYPTVVVTVDLLTTGIDVPEIDTLVFMRRVKSRILFEQMLGRATRRCDAIGKDHFEIHDPVGVYESLEPVNTMKPVSAQANTSFLDLLDGLEQVQTEEQVQYQIDLIAAKLQRKKRHLSSQAQERFSYLSGGMTPDAYIEHIRSLPTQEAKKRLLSNRELFLMLNEGGLSPQRKVIISDHEDELLEHARGYGKGKKPEDYLREFETFITTHINEIAALHIVCTRPQSLTRADLKSLRMELDAKGFTATKLNTAINETTNADIVADIISIVRRYALGTELMSHEERIRRAVTKLKKAHNFSKLELDWLKRIESYLMKEDVLDRSSFDTGAFRTQGGFERINKCFRNELETIITELNTYLYEDGGNIA